jgi:integrating conjugative element protein (TIGR03757 family)
MDKLAQLMVAMALMVLSLTLAYASTPLHSIEVVFNDQTPVSNAETQDVTVGLYNLDAPAAARNSLSQGLPANAEVAKRIVLQRLNQEGSAALNARYQTAYQALTQSLAYGLDRFPAIVFNHGQAVVYGVTDLAVALQMFQQWQVKQ